MTGDDAPQSQAEMPTRGPELREPVVPHSSALHLSEKDCEGKTAEIAAIREKTQQVALCEARTVARLRGGERWKCFVKSGDAHRRERANNPRYSKIEAQGDEAGI